MKLSKYVKELKKLEKEGHGDLELIYSSDEEGNSFHVLDITPSVAYASDLENYYIEDIKFKFPKSTKPNVICIN